MACGGILERLYDLTQRIQGLRPALLSQDGGGVFLLISAARPTGPRLMCSGSDVTSGMIGPAGSA